MWFRLQILLSDFQTFKLIVFHRQILHLLNSKLRKISDTLP